MKCKHGLQIRKCDSCLDKVLTFLIEKKCKCYANAYINIPSSSSNIIRSFTQEELFSISCLAIPLTSSCNGSNLQLGKCKSPQNSWCRYIDRSNSFITSIVVPKGCGGCYNFDLSASVALTATLNISLAVVGAATFPLSFPINVPATVELRLAEQLEREICVTDEVADLAENCFTSQTFPIIDIPYATETLDGTSIGSIATTIVSLIIQIFFFGANLSDIETLLSDPKNISNLSVSGTVCLKDCQRLVPTLTIKDVVNFDNIINLLPSLLPPLIGPPVLVPFTLTNIQLSLSSLSLKLVKLDKCTEDCSCKNF